MQRTLRQKHTLHVKISVKFAPHLLEWEICPIVNIVNYGRYFFYRKGVQIQKAEKKEVICYFFNVESILILNWLTEAWISPISMKKKLSKTPHIKSTRKGSDLRKKGLNRHAKY